MATTAAGAPTAEPVVDTRKMIAFLAMVFGMFMSILDIQVVSASLAEIQAGLSASSDEISWVQTSYLIAEVIMIPLSGFLARLLSTRWLFAGAAAGFTLTSFLCATATSMDQMIVYRALQGFIGGGMIPSVFSAAFTIFPKSKQAFVSPMIGLVATLAPTVGPTIGGYLTEYMSWHWLFLINIVPGIIVTVTTGSLIDFDEPDFSLFERFDWFGLAFMAGFLGCLEYVLEEGPNNDWLQDEAVAICMVVCGVSGVLFFWRVLTAEEPIVSLAAFRNRNFATGSAFSFILGIGLYGLTYVYPQYLAHIRGYNSLQIGETMFVTGLTMFFMAPITGILSRKLDVRILLVVGMIIFGTGTWIASHLTADWDFWELFIPQILRGMGLMMCMVPITNVALGTLDPPMMKNASGLFNLTRNLGGAVGLALINQAYNSRLDLHLQRLHDGANWAKSYTLEYLDTLQRGLAPLGDLADVAALKRLSMLVRQQAMVMAYADTFFLLTCLFALTACCVVILKKPQAAPAGGGGH
ncbi:DHA2 family efflux MFS transporter permease subunit [Terrihabitans rhizophilus]|uniref:DHA2 family efflux MFS transporter permease subunit n=1 Tax=Terrihabitans rhizophilus TaxID=3092662 RepID=A0ABU4RNM4_9HYPH|nr:DHA2 family efflux MFS transporter permease subunit [Terrihabitans sp. PJ23]MDX6806414.1 DHA2 family efflux MFS transporter permease subunit [Terrihabitans sp. PJ23]